jgi:hypothetical protein
MKYELQNNCPNLVLAGRGQRQTKEIFKSMIFYASDARRM